MTKRQRLNVYKKLLAIYKKRDGSPFIIGSRWLCKGFCNEINNLAWNHNCFNTLISKSIKSYPELYSLRPKGKGEGVLWYGIKSRSGINKRIEILEKAIQLCSESTKKST